MTGSRTESYSYDLNGNRTGTGYSTTIMNEIRTSPGLVTYSYDSAGNTISANSGGTFTTYTYDFRSRLTGVKQGGTVIATYTYDALNRRIGVQESGSTTWTIYNGMSPDAMPYGDFNGSGTLLTRYVSGRGVVNGAVVDELLARTSSGGTTAWYLTDKLDSVRDVVSSSASALDHVVYDSFGIIVMETNASNGDRFKFAGMQYDSTSRQYFDQARWYGSVAGRFVSRDPAGFAGRDENLYRYVGDDVTNYIDASGRVNPADLVPAIGVGSVLAVGVGLAGESLIPAGTVSAMAVGASSTAMTAGVAMGGAGTAGAGSVAIGALVVPVVFSAVIAAEAVYAYQVAKELIYWVGEYQAAAAAGAVLDAQIQAARMALAMQAMARQMAAANAVMVLMATKFQLEEARVATLLFGMSLAGAPINLPTGQNPNDYWKKLVEYYDRLCKKLGLDNPYDPKDPPWGGGPGGPGPGGGVPIAA